MSLAHIYVGFNAQLPFPDFSLLTRSTSQKYPLPAAQQGHRAHRGYCPLNALPFLTPFAITSFFPVEPSSSIFSTGKRSRKQMCPWCFLQAPTLTFSTHHWAGFMLVFFSFTQHPNSQEQTAPLISQDPQVSAHYNQSIDPTKPLSTSYLIPCPFILKRVWYSDVQFLPPSSSYGTTYWSETGILGNSTLFQEKPLFSKILHNLL